MLSTAAHKSFARLALAELVDPARENAVGKRFDVEEFDAHADAGLDDADDSEAFDGLPLARERHAHA